MLKFGLLVFFFFVNSAGSKVAIAGPGQDEEKIEAASRFMNGSRINAWNNLFQKDLFMLGKITLKNSARVFSESWFEESYFLIKYIDNSGVETYSFANPSYVGMVEVKNGKSQVLHHGPALTDDKLVYVEALNFAFCSSINVTRESIPSYLIEKKLLITDYRLENGRHHLEFGFTEQANLPKMELIFDDDNPSLLPSEAIFEKGQPQSRHFINSDFREILGHWIPLKLDDKHSDDGSVAEIDPNSRLNQDACYFSFYGLPEPVDIQMSNFGRRQFSVLWLLILSAGLATIVVLYWWRKSKS